MLTDEMLTVQIMGGDSSAFEELINRYKKSVFIIVYRMSGQYQEAEDISQEVFLTVYRKLDQFDSHKKFAPWIHRIAVNTCISALRKKNKAPLINYDDTLLHQNESAEASDFGNPLLAVERGELRTAIHTAISELPPNYQAVLILRYQLDLTNQEIADTLGVNKENIEVKIHRARNALRKVLTTRMKGGEQTDVLPRG